MVAALFQTLDTHFFAMFHVFTRAWIANDFYRLSVNYYVGHYYMKFNNMPHWIYRIWSLSQEVDGGVPVMGVLIKD